MGHFYNKVKATGKNVKEAESHAWDDFRRFNGMQTEIRDIKMIGKVRELTHSPELGEWEFEIHSHA